MQCPDFIKYRNCVLCAVWTEVCDTIQLQTLSSNDLCYFTNGRQTTNAYWRWSIVITYVKDAQIMDRKFKVALIYVGPQFVACCMSPVRNLEIWGSCQILLKILHLWFKPLFVLEIRTQREMRHWSQFFFYLNFMCVIYL